MPAAYDNYDYPSYWQGRDYEHKSEIEAISRFLSRLKNIKTLIEVGAGYGRLVPAYFHRAEKIIITDPSAKLLKIARNKYTSKKFTFIQTKAENLNKKTKAKADLVIVVRVLHHIKDINTVLENINKLISPKGHLILEFANKQHIKQLISELKKGNITYPLDIFIKEKLSKKAQKQGCLPFQNYHPDYITELLNENGFQVVDRLSVSNIRIGFIKNRVGTETLLFFEKLLQKPLSFINFGPSIFILAKKL